MEWFPYMPEDREQQKSENEAVLEEIPQDQSHLTDHPYQPHDED